MHNFHWMYTALLCVISLFAFQWCVVVSLRTSMKIMTGFEVFYRSHLENSRYVRVFWDDVYFCGHGNYSLQVTWFSDGVISNTSEESAFTKSFVSIIPLSEVKIELECPPEINIERKLMVYTVPAQENIIECPNMLFMDFGGGKRGLFWKSQRKDLTNITLFKISADCSKTPQTCYNKSIFEIDTYEYLSPNATSYFWNMDVAGLPRLSLSTASSSSGICTPDVLLDFEQKDDVTLNPSPQYSNVTDYTLITWSLRKPEYVEFLGYPNYSLSYCLLDIKSRKCTEDVIYQSLKDGETVLNVYLDNLRDNSVYQINITSSIINKDYEIIDHVSQELHISSNHTSPIYIKHP